MPPDPRTVVVAISASGRTPETVEALGRHRGMSMTVAITNHPERELAAVADVVLPLLAGEESGGVSSTTFQTTVALLHLVASRIGGLPVEDSLRSAAASQAALFDRRDEWLPSLVAAAEGARALYAIAPVERISS